MSQYFEIIKSIKEQKNPVRAKHSQRFFKTGKGEYGAGDIFLGIQMPEQRKIAQRFIELSLSDVQKLIDSQIHEHRMIGLLIITYKYKSASIADKEKLFKFYAKNSRKINNWDLVDVTCHLVVGDYLQDKKRDLLYQWAKSKNLWEKRLSIISTYAFIRHNDLDDTYAISKKLLNDQHDLIHKAVGWMLREAGKRDKARLENFLTANVGKMPRTMLRYAIEKFTASVRKKWLNKK